MKKQTLTRMQKLTLWMVQRYYPGMVIRKQRKDAGTKKGGGENEDIKKG